MILSQWHIWYSLSAWCTLKRVFSLLNLIKHSPWFHRPISLYAHTIIVQGTNKYKYDVMNYYYHCIIISMIFSFLHRLEWARPRPVKIKLKTSHDIYFGIYEIYNLISMDSVIRSQDPIIPPTQWHSFSRGTFNIINLIHHRSHQL